MIFININRMDKAVVQSILIPKNHFSLVEAKGWILLHGHKIKKIHETEGYYRFRQTDPVYPAKYYSVDLSNGIVLVMMKHYNTKLRI